jgi:hypothetical protein
VPGRNQRHRGLLRLSSGHPRPIRCPKFVPKLTAKPLTFIGRPQRASARNRFRRSLSRESGRDAPPLLLAICEARGGLAGASCFQPRGVLTTPAHRVAIRAAEQRRRAVTARARNRRRAVVRGRPPGRCRLSSEAAAGLRTASRLVAAEQRGVAGWLAPPAMRVVRISDVALPVAGLRGGRRRRSRLGGLRRSRR